MKTPWHLWVVGILATLFNAVGPYDFTQSVLRGPAYLEQFGFSPEIVSWFSRMPTWALFVWGLAVWTALGGSLILLLRRRQAVLVFAVSFVAFCVHLLHLYGPGGIGPELGREQMPLHVIIGTELLALMAYSAWMTKRGVLR